MIKVNIDGIVYEYPKGITLLDISKSFNDKFKFEILVGQVNGDMHSLNYKVNTDSNVAFLMSHLTLEIKFMKEVLYLCL